MYDKRLRKWVSYQEFDKIQEWYDRGITQAIKRALGENELFVDFKATLDGLIEIEVIDYTFLKLMVKADNLLDDIQDEFGQAVYRGFEKEYIEVLMSKSYQVRN